MKRLSRLTALLLAFIMLCTMFASAESGASSGGVAVEDWTLSDYQRAVTAAEDMLGEDLTDPCGETNAYCVYITGTMVNMSAQEIHAYLSDLYENNYSEYIALLLHYGYYHLDSELVCICEIPMSEPELYPVGDLSAHTEADCPWKFENLSFGDQYDVIAAAEDASKYTVLMPAEDQEKLTRVNLTDYTAEATNAEVAINVPEGTFTEDYVLNAASGTLDEAQQSAVDALGSVNPVETFDISFTNLYKETETMQPAEGTAVELTFTIDVSAMDGNILQIYHLADNGDGTYTAEPVGDPVSVDKTQTAQTITVQASAFSTYFAGEGCDGTVCGTDETTGEVVCCYEDIEGKSAEYVHEYLNALYNEEDGGSTLGLFMAHLQMYHSAALSNVCICGTYPLPAPGAAEHDNTDCPWHANNYVPEEERPVTVSADGAYLMCNGVALATINDNGYIIDVATGIAVGIYDETNDTITLGVN